MIITPLYRWEHWVCPELTQLISRSQAVLLQSQCSLLSILLRVICLCVSCPHCSVKPLRAGVMSESCSNAHSLAWGRCSVLDPEWNSMSSMRSPRLCGQLEGRVLQNVYWSKLLAALSSCLPPADSHFWQSFLRCWGRWNRKHFIIHETDSIYIHASPSITIPTSLGFDQRAFGNSHDG